MEPEFWHSRWQSDQLGFHQTEVNPFLVEYWPTLALDPDATVFVPLCGKSLDMRWLRELGHPIIGVEISPIAVRDFFAEASIVPSVEQRGDSTISRGGGYTLYCGDLFDLTPADLAEVGGCYDRASLIALPPSTRARYGHHLAEILPTQASVLLVTLEYDTTRMSGPPHSVDREEVRALFGDHFECTCLYESGAVEASPRFKERGLDRWNELVWCLHHPSAN